MKTDVFVVPLGIEPSDRGNRYDCLFKVVCIKTDINYPVLKIGRIFTVTSKWVWIRDDKPHSYKIVVGPNNTNWMESSYFKELSEWRNQRLDEIGL